jgi:iron complex transport system substrate-binding protein
MTNNITTWGLSFLFSIACLSTHAAKYPVTVIDDRNKEVVFDTQPKTVASISVFGADLMAALGERAAGLSTLNHKQSAFLGEELQYIEDLGEVHETNMELLTKIDPDLTIGIRTYTEPFEKKFEEIGKFLAFDMVTYKDSIRAIETVGTVLGKRQSALQLNAKFADQLSEFKEKAPGGLSVVMLWHWGNVQYAFFDHHLTVEIMRTLGITNSFGESPNKNIKKMDSAPLSMEALLKLDPDIIISFKGEDGPVLNHPVWSRLSATINGRVYRIGDQYVMPHGPIARDMVLREVAYLFYPEYFPQPTDIPENARATQTTFTAD